MEIEFVARKILLCTKRIKFQIEVQLFLKKVELLKNQYNMLKILHTSDLHLGQKLIEKDRNPEHIEFLNWLVELINAENIDALIIAGDVFDTGSPSNQALELYYRFLAQIVKSKCKYVFVLGGNHDSPAMLNAPKEYLKFSNIFVVGCAPETVEEQVFEIQNDNEKAVIALVPFLRDRDIRKASVGENVLDIESKIKNGIVSHYQAIANYIQQNFPENMPAIATGHLFVAGSSVSEGEKDIHVGNLGAIQADVFPERFQYVALGHIHRPQALSKNAGVRYSGSPIPLSFSEYNHEKKVVLLEIVNSVLSQKLINVPITRRLERISGDILEITDKLSKFKKSTSELMPWIDVTIKLETNELGIYEKVKALENPEHFEILKISTDIKNKEPIQFYESELTLQEFSVEEVFFKRCESQSIDLTNDDNKQLLFAFKEILETVNQ